MSKSRIIQLECNELCPSLMERFIAAGKLPNFKRMRDESQLFITDAEEQQEALEPWIQWITVHTGLRYEEHGVFNLGDAHKLQARSVWDFLSEKNYKVWICGSMNLKYEQPINGLVLPDAWSSERTPCTPELEPLCNFVRRSVQEHTNEKVPMSKADYFRVLSFLLSHGLSLSTTTAILGQLFSEARGRDGWKRAVLLDKLLWDVFAYIYRREQPDFATLFSNSCAHFQHKYWRNMEPELFSVKPSAAEQEQYRDAILFAYQQTDQLMGKALQLADENTTLVFATALSQQPYLGAEDDGGKVFYRPHDFSAFAATLGLTGVTQISPVMSEEFHVYFDNESAAEQGLQTLLDLRLDDNRPVMKARREGNDVFAGCQIFAKLGSDAVLQLPDGTQRALAELFYQADSVKSGMHHPDGMFWVRNPSRTHKPAADKLALREIAPAILAHYDITVPGLPSTARIDF